MQRKDELRNDCDEETETDEGGRLLIAVGTQ